MLSRFASLRAVPLPVLVLVVPLALAVACSAKSTGHPAAPDTSGGNPSSGGRPGGGTTDGGAVVDGGTCTTLSLASAGVIGQQQIAEAAPVPVGGTIPDGTYVLTKDTIFAGPGGTTGATGVTLQEVQAFSGTGVQVLSQPHPPAPLASESGTYSITSTTSDAGTSTGFTLTFSFTCPSQVLAARSYSVVNGTILEFVGTNEVRTYTQQ